MSSPSFNTFQQIFALSWASNLAAPCIGSAFEIQEKLSRVLNDDHLEKNVGPGWRMAWGPAVWQHNPTEPVGPDNVWYIAKHDSFVTDGADPTPVYVVCIAATVGTGKGFDGKVEDLVVGKVVDLNQWIPDSFAGEVLPGPTEAANPHFTGSTPYVSYGTAIGTYVITSMSLATADGQPSTHPCISAFLKNVSAEPGARIIFTGHSLGSFLCTTSAFVLAKANILNRFTKVLVYPTAGAATGDANYVSEFKKRFPPIPPAAGQPVYMTWNQNITNSLDIVPHSWCTLDTYPQNLSGLPTIYGNSPDHGKIPYLYLAILKDSLVKGAKKAWPGEAKDKQNVYIPLPSSVFSSGEKPYPKTQAELEQMFLFCHIRAYLDLFYGPDYTVPPGPCTKTASDVYSSMGQALIMRYAEDVSAEQAEEWSKQPRSE